MPAWTPSIILLAVVALTLLILGKVRNDSMMSRSALAIFVVMLVFIGMWISLAIWKAHQDPPTTPSPAPTGVTETAAP